MKGKDRAILLTFGVVSEWGHLMDTDGPYT